MKILIADDEYYTVEMLEQQIDWNILGITEVLKAYNGKDALKKIEEQNPDLVICDIEMPQLDGLMVLQRVREEKKEIPFIMLTGFEKFEYAKEAIHYGACEYLTKPFEVQEIVTAVLKVIREIGEKKEIAKKGEYWEKNRSLVKQEFLKKLLLQDIPSTPEAINRILREQGQEYEPNKARRMILILFTNLEDFSPEDQELYCFSFRNITSEILCGNPDNNEILVMPVENFYAVVAFLGGEGENEGIARQRCRKLIETGEKYLKMEITCIIGESVGVIDASREWNRLKTLAAESVLEPGQILPDWKKHTVIKPVETAFDMEFFLKCLDEQDEEKAVRYVGGELERLQGQQAITPEFLKRLQTDIMQEVYSFLKKRGVQAHLLYLNDGVQKLQERARRSPFHMIRWIELLCQVAFGELEKLKNKGGVIRDVEAYIQAHFKENITRTEIAEQVYLTPNYLSKLFHDEKGISIPEYISLLRIEAAKELIVTTDWPMGRIGMEVGFESIAYFSTTFKKVCGCSPVQWVNRQKK